MSAVFVWRDAVRRPPPGRELPPTDRLVALVLSFYMDQDTLENARPGPARLARETGLSLRTVKTSLERLITAKWIVQTSRGGTRRGRSERIASVYAGVLPAGPESGVPTSEGRAPVQQMHGSEMTSDARVPVQEDPFTGAADAHHLVPDLEPHLCVADLAFTKLKVQKGVDTHAQRCELDVKVKRLVAIHGEDAVRDVLEDADFPPAPTPFAGELDRQLKEHLPDTVAAVDGYVDRRQGYIPGHKPDPKYPVQNIVRAG